MLIQNMCLNLYGIIGLIDFLFYLRLVDEKYK